MQRDSRSLERALQDAGLQTDAGSLSFNLRNNNGGNARQFANYVQPTGRRDLGAFAGEVEDMSFIATPTGRVGRDRVDIRI
jgi:flagellar hook-length control protein FliK